MRSILAASAILAVLSTASAAAQVKQTGAPAKAAVTWATLAGDWSGKSVKGHPDTVLTTFTMTFTADKKASMTLPNRPKIGMTVISMAGDSVVMKTDKYESVTRKGHMTWLTSVAHIHGNSMTGTFNGTFDDGKTLEGRLTGTRKGK